MMSEHVAAASAPPSAVEIYNSAAHRRSAEEAVALAISAEGAETIRDDPIPL